MKLKQYGLIAIVVVLTLSSTAAWAQDTTAEESVGAGLGLASLASGVSLKAKSDWGVSFQGVVGTVRGDIQFTSVAATADILYELPTLASGSVASLGWNIGLGASVGAVFDQGETLVGGLGILGFGLDLVSVPVELAVEFRPGIYRSHTEEVSVGPNTEIGILPIDAGAHLRYWF